MFGWIKASGRGGMLKCPRPPTFPSETRLASQPDQLHLPSFPLSLLGYRWIGGMLGKWRVSGIFLLESFIPCWPFLTKSYLQHTNSCVNSQILGPRWPPKILVKPTCFLIFRNWPFFFSNIWASWFPPLKVLRRGRLAFEVVFTGLDRTDRTQTPAARFFPPRVKSRFAWTRYFGGGAGQGGTSYYSLKYIHGSGQYCQRRLRRHPVANVVLALLLSGCYQKVTKLHKWHI